MPSIPFTIVDAFADAPFTGNPAAVVPLDAPADPRWMQQVAAEFNLSETAFAWPEAGGFRIRWFTPTVEVALCGHATLATAAVLWRDGRATADRIDFVCASGAIAARRERQPAPGNADGAQGEHAHIVLDFPVKVCAPAPISGELAQALGVTALRGGGNGMDWLVEVAHQSEVAGLRPDHGAIARLPVRGVIVTAPGAPGSGWDVVSRFFAPGSGIAEDPVTGSAHCALLPWWAPRLGRDALVCRQLSARGGTVHGRWRGDRVDLGGTAVVVAEGRLR